MYNYLLKIPNISYQHCVMRIKKALEEIGEKDFEISLEEKIVKISTKSLEGVKEKLSEIDYPISEAKKL
ncbi:MAG: heavy-metal-associated domain-containing protein [Thermosipho sp. (in: Bacteria)]|nr:heavy-metal-associated domain-containing protein [Thermosipho sp. (in: thermotogales)]